jgi:hypothetical protein
MARLTISVRTLTVVGLLVLIAAPAFAQADAHPEYAGTWDLNYKRSNFRKHKQNAPRTVVVTLSGSTIEFRFTNDGKTERDDTYTVDGNEHFLRENENAGKSGTTHSRTYYTAEWKDGKDDVLAIQIRIATEETSDAPSFGAYEGYSYRAKDTWNLSRNRRVLGYTTVAPGLNDAIRVYDKR